MSKLALKRLTASDLTLFKFHYETIGAGNQKSINLNADVFVQILYPSLQDRYQSSEARIPLDLNVFGPGLRGVQNLQRKIIKGGSYKNWRLDGEFIHTPDDQPEKYRALVPNDLAIFEFIGDIIPSTANLILVAQNISEDVDLYNALITLLPVSGKKSMIALPYSQLSEILHPLSLAPDHPVLQLVDQGLEEYTLGGAEDSARLDKPPLIRIIPPERFYRAKMKTEENGRIGEIFINTYLHKLQVEGEIESFEWTANHNAVSPFDFKVKFLLQAERVIDVKSTAGNFSNNIHISTSELRQMAFGQEEYDIYRVYDLKEETARLRKAHYLRIFARGVIDKLMDLPSGVSCDIVSVNPRVINFEEEEIVLDSRYIDE